MIGLLKEVSYMIIHWVINPEGTGTCQQELVFTGKNLKFQKQINRKKYPLNLTEFSTTVLSGLMATPWVITKAATHRQTMILRMFYAMATKGKM